MSYPDAIAYGAIVTASVALIALALAGVVSRRRRRARTVEYLGIIAALEEAESAHHPDRCPTCGSLFCPTLDVIDLRDEIDLTALLDLLDETEEARR